MQDSLIQLAAYGFLVRMIVEFIQMTFKIPGASNPRLVQAIVGLVSVVFVYLLDLNPAGMLKMSAAAGVAVKPVGVALLAGAAMSANDILDLIPKLGRLR